MQNTDDGVAHDAHPQALPPHAQLIQMGTASFVSAVLYAAAKLGVADHLSSGPRSAAELAGPTGTHAPSLHRLLRSLASLGVLTEGEEQRFALTPLGEALRSGAPGSARASLLTLCGPLFWNCWQELPYSLETGRSGFERLHGMPVFEYMAQHPDVASAFSETMVGFHGAEPPAVAEAYDFSGIRTLVDVGGATGNMLSAVLSRHGALRGVLFDLPHVVSDAPALLEARGVGDRVSVEAGSFFEGVPSGGDAYLLSHVLHDWPEEQCLAILGNCREAMPRDGRLLVVETVLPPGDTPHPGKLLDMAMLVLPGGQERTETEYAALLGRAGFRLNRVVPTASAVSVVEASLA